MRTWRVGTISMGLLLILLGVFLVFTQLFDWKPAYAMTGWWPVIFIVLGIEILVYLLRSKQENSTVKYDLFSIFFIGFIGVVGIGFASLHATGLLDKLQAWMNVEVKTFDLPTFEMNLDDHVTRVVVNTSSYPFTIETGKTNDVSVFGTYETTILDGKIPIEQVEDYLFTERKGDTLFVTLKQMPETFQPFHSHREWNTTMIVPDNVQVEIKADYYPLHVNTRTMKNDWTIENASEVNVQLFNDLDVKLHAENIDELNTWEGWEVASQTDDEQHVQSGTRQFGKGTHVMNIFNASNVTVMTKE